MDWKLPPGLNLSWFAKTVFYLGRIHVGVCAAWRPEECLKVEIYPFNWVNWGAKPAYPNQIFFGPLNIYVVTRPFPWETK